MGRSHQFDDQGITVRNLFRTYRIGWGEVRRFTDGSIGGYMSGPDESPGHWALAIVLHDGRTVAAVGRVTAIDAASKTLAGIVQAAQRYGIAADLTGTIERGSFPATLLGASGMITVTIRDGRSVDHGHEPILEVVDQDGPVQPGDILALSHDGTEVEVVGVRQIVAGRRWEQVAYVYLVEPWLRRWPKPPAEEVTRNASASRRSPSPGRSRCRA